MGSQPNLVSRSEVVLIYKCPRKVWSPSPQIWGAKIILQLFSRLLQCPVKVDLLSVTFDPEKGWDLFRHCDPPYEYSTFFVLAGLPTRIIIIIITAFISHLTNRKWYRYPPRRAALTPLTIYLSLIHIWRCRRSTLCRSRWSPYH